MKNSLKQFLAVGWGEGISYIILLGIAMPLKYMFDMPAYLRIIGMLHGVLFILYIVALLKAKSEYKWSAKAAIGVFLLSLVPFGTFFLKKIIPPLS